uniref:Pseudouridine synthase II N-terminal domain-containing protein n=1 Tax=Glossina brevipalpis TaxID=37001 RepID=A0A1A9WQZ9_9MUSC
MPLMKVYNPATVVKHLNGLINVYKPSGMKLNHVKRAILHNICRDLNEMYSYQIEAPKHSLLEPGGAANPILRQVHSLNLAEEVLTKGLPYEMDAISCVPILGLGFHTSGVLILGLNKGIREHKLAFQKKPSIRAYHVTVSMGFATENYFSDSRKTVRAHYTHVRANRISDLASSLQASHQRKMYELCGVDLQSQAAYELACKGLIRPVEKTQPVLYSIKLIEFQPPCFTLEIHAINETEAYLAALVNDMAIELRTVGHCSAIRCIRHGPYTVEKSLLRHGWNLAGVVRNMREQMREL